jgi:hypothetical protein
MVDRKCDRCGEVGDWHNVIYDRIDETKPPKVYCNKCIAKKLKTGIIKNERKT